ncbi:MAG: response regulator [Anaerolineae bacterium]|nr:response regulator [Anaerolineae bacterium]
MTETKTILCIEDESGMIELLRFILEREGYGFVEARGGEEGLRLARELQPDLVLLDLMMPGMDGWEVYRQIKADQALRQIPVIVVTARADNIDKVLGLYVAQVDDYVAKPFEPEDLLVRIRRVLGAA